MQITYEFKNTLRKERSVKAFMNKRFKKFLIFFLRKVYLNNLNWNGNESYDKVQWK